jgi:glycosyltransferase involved in cell wall biosynthesis
MYATTWAKGMPVSVPDIIIGSGRVSIVTETFPPEINGVANTLNQLSTALSRFGNRVQIVRPRQAVEKTSVYNSFEVITAPGLPIPGYRELRFGIPIKKRLLKLWKEQRPDVIYIATEGPLGSSALQAARSLDIPVASGFHTRFDHYTKHYGIGWLEPLALAYLRRFHNRCQLTLVPTRAMQDKLQRQGFQNVALIARGVDTQLFSPARRDNTLRNEWGLRDDDLALIYVGRLAAEKNLKLVVDAWLAIRQDRPGTRLILVGDGPMRGALQKDHPEIIFCGMHRGESLARHYASGDLFLFPSLSETFGNVVIEAMASGLPVLGYRDAAIKEFVRHQENGIVIEAGDRQQFIRAARESAQEPELLVRLGKQARKDSLAMDWPKIHCRFAMLLSEIQEDHSHEPAPAYE